MNDSKSSPSADASHSITSLIISIVALLSLPGQPDSFITYEPCALFQSGSLYRPQVLGKARFQMTYDRGGPGELTHQTYRKGREKALLI